MELPLLIHVLMVLASVVWLFLLVKIPWDLYFAARRGRIDADESLAKGIGVAPQDREDLATLERRLLRAALGAHVLTALGIGFIGRLSGGLVRGEFAWLFLFSAAFRPAWEVHKYLRVRLAELCGRVRYPRQDVQELLGRFEMLVGQVQALEAEHGRDQSAMVARVGSLDEAMRAGHGRQHQDSARLGQRITDLSVRFEQAVAQMGADQELLAGVRAFARMFRQDAAPHVG